MGSEEIRLQCGTWCRDVKVLATEKSQHDGQSQCRVQNLYGYMHDVIGSVASQCQCRVRRETVRIWLRPR